MLTRTFEPVLRIVPPDVAPWPAEVQLILSALEAGEGPGTDRRKRRRVRYRVRASLKLFSDLVGAPPWQLFTRDASPRSLGFLTPHRLPLGYGGKVQLAGPGGAPVVAHCTLFRCREAAPGWYEGALSFNRPQFVFAAEGDD